MQDRFTLTFNAIGTMTADADWRWTAPIDCTLIHVSAVVSGVAKAGLTIGTSDDVDEFLTKQDCGGSGVPATFDFDDFATYSDKAYPRIEAGDVVITAVDYDYNAGGGAAASADLTVVLTFLAG